VLKRSRGSWRGRGIGKKISEKVKTFSFEAVSSDDIYVPEIE
jgi:hypothetical protein